MPLSNALLKKRADTLRLGLDQRLSELYSSYYPNSKPEILINCLQCLLKHIDDLLESCEERKLRWICSVLEELEYFLPDLHNVNTEEVPRGLVLIVEGLAEKLFPDVVLMSSPQREDFNYGIEDLLPYLEEYIENLFPQGEKNTILDLAEQRIDVIRFPRIERDNVFSYPIFGHELGHPIADEYLSNEETTRKYNTRREKAVKEIRELLGIEFQGNDIPIEISKDSVERMLQIRKRGLQELISDCVGVLLFGPSALFAFHDFFLKDYLDKEPEDSEYYPPHRYRLRLMKKIMDDEGYTDALKSFEPPTRIRQLNTKIESYLEYIKKLVEDETDKTILYSDPELQIPYSWLEQALPDAIAYARKRVDKFVYPSGCINKQVPDLINALTIGIPPNETGIYPDRRHADWRSSILAGWLYKIGDFSIPFNDQLTLDRSSIDRLQRLTLRAVELVLFEADYVNKKNQFLAGEAS